jgi:hypothetical protein
MLNVIYINVQLINITAAFIKGKVTTTCRHKVMKLTGVQAVKLNTMYGPKRGSHMTMGNKCIIVYQCRGVGGWNVLRTYGAWKKRTEF